MTIELKVVWLLLRLTVLALLLLALLLAYRSLSLSQQASVLKSGLLESTTLDSDAPEASAILGQLVDRTIEESKTSAARWGIHVISLGNDQILYSSNGDKLLTPASNMKLFTTAVALDLLGADYRWRTSVYSDTQPDASGTLQGDLVLFGRGAPDLVSTSGKDNYNSLSELASILFQRGLRRVNGRVIGDESYFRGEPIGDGWQWNDLQWSFGAEASALSVNNNEVAITIIPPVKSNEPPEVKSNDSNGYVRLLPRITTVKRSEPFKLGIQRGLSDNEVRVWGEFPFGSRGYGAQLAVHGPALWSARLFLDILRKHGVAVEGRADSRDARVPESERFVPSRSNELAWVTSKSLIEIITATNKESLNLSSELILRTLGRERRGLLGEPPEGRELGDDEAGAKVIRLWLAKAGIPTQGLAIHDGSGLSRLNLITAESATRLLSTIRRTSLGQRFLETLPISGKDGTLRGRLLSLSNRVSAKTGALMYDNALSGYLLAENGEVLVFSIMVNDHTTPGSSIRVIDEIAAILADYPYFKRENGKTANFGKQPHRRLP